MARRLPTFFFAAVCAGSLLCAGRGFSQFTRYLDFGSAVWKIKSFDEPVHVTTMQDTSSNTWHVITGGDAKTKIETKGQSLNEGVNLIVNSCKKITVKKPTLGSIGNIYVGTVDTNSPPVDLASFVPATPVKGVTIKLIGCDVNTVICGNVKKVIADSIVNFATDGGFKGKGAKIMTRDGEVGGIWNDYGFLGAPTNHPIPAVAQSMSDDCRIKMVKAQGRIEHLDVYARGATVNGRPVGKMKAKLPGGKAVMHTAEGWRLDKFMNVIVEQP